LDQVDVAQIEAARFDENEGDLANLSGQNNLTAEEFADFEARRMLSSILDEICPSHERDRKSFDMRS
jgi:hypothetical protein